MAYFRWTGGNGGTPPTPVQEAYLYNNDLVYFNTGHKHTPNTKIRMKALFNWVNNYMQAWGARSDNFRNNAFGFFPSFAGPRPCIYRTNEEKEGSNYSAASSDTTTMFYMEPVVLECEGQAASWYAESDSTNVHSITATTGTVNSGIAPIAIWGCNAANIADAWWPVDGAIMKLYWFEIYENDTLEHRFVPAYNNGQYCLYDEVDQAYIYEAAGNYTRLRGSSNIPTT